MLTATFTQVLRIGQLVITRGALAALDTDDVMDALLRHMSGDWGTLDEQDWKTNDDALEYGARVLSQYSDKRGTKFWIITEHDRSLTTILLPDEY